MKKNYGFIVLAMLLAFSASAEQVWIHCRNCGKTVVTEKGKCPFSWGYHNGDYFCGKEKCKSALDNSIDASRIAAEADAINEAKNKVEFVNTVCAKLRGALIASKGDPNKQISIMKQIVSFCIKKDSNAVVVWAIFVAYADLDAVKYFWPDPANENVYSASKKQMESNKGKGLKWNLDTWKTGPGALALGRSKKDDSIRFVDNIELAVAVLSAAMVNDRSDVVSYFLKQSQGVTPVVAAEIARQWMMVSASAKYNIWLIEQNLSTAEKNRKVADDKQEAAKIDKQIATIKDNLEMVKAVSTSDATLSLVFGYLDPYRASECYFKIEEWIYDGLKYGENHPAYLPDALFYTDLLAKDKKERSDYAFIYWKDLRANEKSEISSSLTPLIRKSLDNVFANASGELGEWYKWRAELKKNWRAGIVDKWVNALKTGTSPDEWVWRPGCPNDNGYASDYTAFKWVNKNGLTSSEHPGYTSKWDGDGVFLAHKINWVWTPGCHDITRAGYVAGEKEGEFYWKAGIPDPKRIGFVSGDKEGEFVVCPGFKKQKDGQASWTSGLPHPKYPGVVSADKMFFWIPDKDHYWANDKYGYVRRYVSGRIIEYKRDKNEMSIDDLFETEKDCDVACGELAEMFKRFILVSGTPIQDMIIKDKE